MRDKKLYLLLLLILFLPSFFHDFYLVSVVTDYLADFFPAIDRYGSATKASGEARALWAFGWVYFPLMIAAYVVLPKGVFVTEAMMNRKIRAFVFLIFLLSVSFFCAYFGFLDGGDLVSSAKVSRMFRGGFFGVLFVGYIYWLCFYLSFFCMVDFVVATRGNR